jgi:phosphohistidine phosphatase
MIKELILVRHAKSDWGNEFLKDVDRHLSERGYNDAYLMSEWYLKNKKAPALILSSPATRALNTALIFSRALDLSARQLILEPIIYESTANKLLSVIHDQQDDINSVMMFGHNPSFTNICNELSEDMFFDNVPTSGIVSFSFGVNRWKDIIPKKGKLNYHQFPKDFRNKN